MSYSESDWKEFFPDPDERAEAKEKMASLAQSYDPAGVKYDGDPEQGFFVKVIDKAGAVNDFWVDIWIDKRDIEEDWNDIVVDTWFRGGQWYLLQQEDPIITEKAMDAAFEYICDLGLIVQLPNGDWRYANPDEYAVRRDAIVSLARKAKANQAKGVGKLTGRFRF